MPGACYHHGLYFYEPDGPATVVNRDSAHDTCLQLLNDVPDDGAHHSISDMLNECVNGGQCDGSSSDAAGMQQCGESVSEPALVDDVPHGDDSNASVIDLDVLESELKDAWLGVLEDELAHTAGSHAISENVVEPCVTDSCATSDHAVHTVSGAGQHDGSCDDSNVVLHMNTRHYKKSGVTGKKHETSYMCTKFVTRARELMKKGGLALKKGLSLFSPKVTPKERTRAPTYHEAMHDALHVELNKTCTHPMPPSGPVLDSAATVPAICKKLSLIHI